MNKCAYRFAITILGFLLTPLATTQGAAQTRYTLTDLGLLPGATWSHATGINDSGTVVGFCSGQFPYSFQSFIWTKGAGMQPLDARVSAASAINARGDVTGWADIDGGHGEVVNHALRWNSDKTVTDLQVTAGLQTGFFGAITSGASINQAGQVAGGFSDTGSMACVWLTDSVATLPFEGWSAFTGINDAGVAVGYGIHNGTPPTGVEIAFKYTALGGVVSLHPAGHNASVANGINSHGEVCGLAGSELALWSSTGEFTGLGSGWGHAINDNRWIVGLDFDGNAILWTPTSNGIKNLNNLVDNLVGWHLDDATAINGKGQIVGTGTLNGNPRAYLLTPVDSTIPSSNVKLLDPSNSNQPVVGIVCDNLRDMPADMKNRLTITLPDGYSPASDPGAVDDGAGHTMDGTTNNVGTLEMYGGKLTYVPPLEFNENQTPQDVSQVTKAATRKVYVTVKAIHNGQPVTFAPKEIVLARPPVVLVHGINSVPSAWLPFELSTTTTSPTGLGIDVPMFTVNHHDSEVPAVNDKLFAGNGAVEIGAALLGSRITAVRDAIRSSSHQVIADPVFGPYTYTYRVPGTNNVTYINGLAIRRVDVVAWSYGGVITRWYLASNGSSESLGWYKTPWDLIAPNPAANYVADGQPIRKVITWGSMWRGVPLCNLANEVNFGAVYPSSSGVFLGDSPLSPLAVSIGTMAKWFHKANTVPHSLKDVVGVIDTKIPTTKPSMQVIAVNSPWLKYLIYGAPAGSTNQAAPFKNDVAYGSVGGDTKQYPIDLGAPIGSINLDLYSTLTVLQQASWFPYLPLEQRDDKYARNASDGLVPLWSSEIPGSYKIAPASHNAYPSDRDSRDYTVQWLNHAGLPKGSDLNNIWNDPSKASAQTLDGAIIWHLNPTEMAPHAQNDVYQQVDGIGRISPSSLRESDRTLTVTSVGSTSAIASWVTGTEADSRVTLYSFAVINNQPLYLPLATFSSPTRTKIHQVLLMGLKPQTTYFYQVSYAPGEKEARNSEEATVLTNIADDTSTTYAKPSFITTSTDKPDLLVKAKSTGTGTFDMTVSNVGGPAKRFRVIDMNFTPTGSAVSNLGELVFDTLGSGTKSVRYSAPNTSTLLVRINYEYFDIKGNRITGNSAWLRLK